MPDRSQGKPAPSKGPSEKAQQPDPLDEALDESFPASDPPAMTVDVEPGNPDHDPDEALRRKAAERAQVKGPRAPNPGKPSKP